MKISNALAGATFAVAIMLAGTSAAAAAAAVNHPAPLNRGQIAQVDGAIVVAKKSKGAFIGGLIVGAGTAIILNEAAKAEERRERRRRRREREYRPEPTSADPYERCAYRFRSFRYSDGTYQPYGGGPREVCPYLY